MSVRENVAFGLRNARVSNDEIERRITDAARVLEIEDEWPVVVGPSEQPQPAPRP